MLDKVKHGNSSLKNVRELQRFQLVSLALCGHRVLSGQSALNCVWGHRVLSGQSALNCGRRTHLVELRSLGTLSSLLSFFKGKMPLRGAHSHTHSHTHS